MRKWLLFGAKNRRFVELGGIGALFAALLDTFFHGYVDGALSRRVDKVR